MHTHYGEVHDLEDPDGERKVDQDEDHEEEDKEIKATFPPAVDAHFVHVRFLCALDIVPMSELFLGHLKKKSKGYFRWVVKICSNNFRKVK